MEFVDKGTIAEKEGVEWKEAGSQDRAGGDSKYWTEEEKLEGEIAEEC